MEGHKAVAAGPTMVLHDSEKQLIVIGLTDSAGGVVASAVYTVEQALEVAQSIRVAIQMIRANNTKPRQEGN